MDGAAADEMENILSLILRAEKLVLVVVSYEMVVVRAHHGKMLSRPWSKWVGREVAAEERRVIEGFLCAPMEKSPGGSGR